jgi:C-terminal processing protease CtpA/Prc
MKNYNSITFKMKMFTSVAFFLFCMTIQAQKNNSQKENTLTNKQKNVVLDSLINKLRKTYVFPEVSLKIEKKIRENQKNGLYSKISNGVILADSLTRQLYKISNDKHFSVFFRPKTQTSTVNDLNEEKKRADSFKQYLIHNNYGFTKIGILDGNIGYLKIDGFGPVEEVGKILSSAMTFLTNTDAIILDLTENHGGEPKMVQLFASYFFDTTPVHLNDIYWREGNETEQFWTLPKIAGDRYLNKSVYILTSNETFSAGEEFAYDLQTLQKAIVVGETTKGGANPGEAFPIEYGFGVFIPTGRAINPITKTNWEGIGVKPDVEIKPENVVNETHVLALKKLIEITEDKPTKDFFKFNLDKTLKKHQ